MKSVWVKKVSPEVKLPGSNPFLVQVIGWTEFGLGEIQVQTGLSLGLPEGSGIEVTTLVDGLYVSGHTLDKGGEGDLVVYMRGFVPLVEGQNFAEVRVVESKSVPVRFCEMEHSGKRRFFGDSKGIEP